MQQLTTQASATSTIEEFDKSCQTYLTHLKKVREQVGRAKKVLESRPSPKAIEKLIGDLQALAQPVGPSVPDFLSRLGRQLAELGQSLTDSFLTELRRACAAEQITVQPHGEGFGVGPFLLGLDLTHEQASLTYAKVELARLPLIAKECVEKVKQLKGEIIDVPVDVKRTRASIEEAMRVSLARKNKLAKGELRVELPQLFREMRLIKLGDQVPSTRLQPAYSLPRFVVELSRLVQSDENLDSKQRLGLETAVLENAKDSRKSIFIPKDLARGYDEGTYFQALTLRTE